MTATVKNYYCAPGNFSRNGKGDKYSNKSTGSAARLEKFVKWTFCTKTGATYGGRMRMARHVVPSLRWERQNKTANTPFRVFAHALPTEDQQRQKWRQKTRQHTSESFHTCISHRRVLPPKMTWKNTSTHHCEFWRMHFPPKTTDAKNGIAMKSKSTSTHHWEFCHAHFPPKTTNAKHDVKTT